jgi:hypothetical protein
MKDPNAIALKLTMRFCRTDSAALVSDSLPPGGGAGTAPTAVVSRSQFSLAQFCRMIENDKQATVGRAQ